MKNRFKILAGCITLATFLSISDGLAQTVFTAFSYYDSNKYEFRITEGALTNAPQWQPDVESNPPLSAASALTKAKEYIATVKTAGKDHWNLTSLGLEDNVSQGQWYWRAEWRSIRGEETKSGLIVWSGHSATMQCFILMDGTVIKPILSKYK